MKSYHDRKLSQQQAEANRQNAQKSTGPRTPEGKAASSRNGLTHGLSGDKHFILEGEDPEAFLRLLQDLHDHLRPVGDSEELVVQRIAAAQWRLDRAFALETGIYREESVILTRMDLKRQTDHEFYMNRDGKHTPPDPHEPDDLLARAFMEGWQRPRQLHPPRPLRNRHRTLHRTRHEAPQSPPGRPQRAVSRRP